MAIALLYSFRIMLAGCDSMLARRDLLFQLDKSQSLSFSIVFNFKTIIEFIVYYRFLSFTIKFLSFTIKFLTNVYQILSNFIVLGQYQTLEEF